MKLSEQIQKLVAYAEKYLGLDKRDETYIRNRLCDILAMEGCEACDAGEIPALPDPILEEIFCLLEGEGREIDRATLGEKLMDAVSLRPSECEKIFWEKYAHSPAEATGWAYDYAIRSNYVKKSAIDKNIKWRAADGLEITINLSKPEKNNKDLKKQLAAVSTSYPKCTICRENEGYERAGFSRRNMRTISLELGGEEWFWQYSPYAYFNEHGIAISVAHTPMVLDSGTVEKLFDFVELFPHYFIGNNAPLPRVGGSILMHNHFQGGGYRLPMQRASVRTPLQSARFAGVRAGILDWHNSALRLEGENRKELAAVALDIIEAWKNFEDREEDIIPYTTEPHNTASCIARKTEKGYILDMILRNNRCDETYPDGIFHAHGERHHIKSESIGLIEAMGLFILPARLKRQLKEAEEYLTGERSYSQAALAEDMKGFAPMIERLMREHGRVTVEDAQSILRREVEDTCRDILADTAVFKRNERGERGFFALLAAAGLQPI